VHNRWSWNWVRWNSTKEHDNLILGEKKEQGFTLAEGQLSGNPKVDINVLTRGLASKSEDNQQSTIYHVLNQGKRVININKGVLLVPPGHGLTAWNQNDARLQRWHHSKTLEELLQAAQEMEQDPRGSEEQLNVVSPAQQAGENASSMHSRS
jgi:hypothetical protein